MSPHPAHRRRGHFGWRVGVPATQRVPVEPRHRPRQLKDISPPTKRVLSVLSGYPEKPSEIARKARVRDVTNPLYRLSERGLAIKTGGGWKRT